MNAGNKQNQQYRVQIMKIIVNLINAENKDQLHEKRELDSFIEIRVLVIETILPIQNNILGRFHLILKSANIKSKLGINMYSCFK